MQQTRGSSRDFELILILTLGYTLNVIYGDMEITEVSIGKQNYNRHRVRRDDFELLLILTLCLHQGWRPKGTEDTVYSYHIQSLKYIANKSKSKNKK